jgi:UDPglucose 6-dehydrogenase
MIRNNPPEPAPLLACGANDAVVLALDLQDAPEQLEAISFHDHPMQALQNADALVIATEWKAYRSPDFAAVKAALLEPVIFDGRNLYEPTQMREAGFAYVGIGRPA